MINKLKQISKRAMEWTARPKMQGIWVEANDTTFVTIKAIVEGKEIEANLTYAQALALSHSLEYTATKLTNKG